MSTKKNNIISEALNLTKTQNGYVPLSNRFKSFPKDSEKEPVTDSQLFFNNYANGTLEHTDLGLLFPTPKWLRRRLIKEALNGLYFTTGDDGTLLIVNNRFLVGTEAK